MRERGRDGEREKAREVGKIAGQRTKESKGGKESAYKSPWNRPELKK
jgi:hypothetical protein